MSQYKKFAVVLLASVLSALAPAIGDGALSAAEIVNVIIMTFAAVSVLGAGNLPEGVWKYTKGYVAAGSAIAVFVASAITDGMFTGAEGIQAVLAGLAAVGVVAVSGPKVTI